LQVSLFKAALYNILVIKYILCQLAPFNKQIEEIRSLNSLDTVEELWQKARW